MVMFCTICSVKKHKGELGTSASLMWPSSACHHERYHLTFPWGRPKSHRPDEAGQKSF